MRGLMLHHKTMRCGRQFIVSVVIHKTIVIVDLTDGSLLKNCELYIRANFWSPYLVSIDHSTKVAHLPNDDL